MAAEAMEILATLAGEAATVAMVVALAATTMTTVKRGGAGNNQPYNSSVGTVEKLVAALVE